MAGDRATGKNTELSPIPPLGTEIMSKHEKTGYTATEVQSEGVILSVAESKPELPVYAEYTGLMTAVGIMKPALERLPEKIHAVATAQEKTAALSAEITERKDDALFQLILQASGFKMDSISANLTESGKRGVNVEIATIRQGLISIQESLNALESKYGSKPVVQVKGKSTGSANTEGNITADNKGDLTDLLYSRGFENISFELQPNGKNYRVYANKPGFSARNTLFTSNVNRDWI
jgi:hypothetical protein